MKNLQFKFSLIAFIAILWLALLPGLAEAQAPSWAPSEGYSYVTKGSSQQWMVWSNVNSLQLPFNFSYEHETVLLQDDFANRAGQALWTGEDSEDPMYWWSDLPTPYRDTRALDSTGRGTGAGCDHCDNFAIGSADPQLIQANRLYRTVDFLQDDNPNLTTARVRMNGQLVDGSAACPEGQSGRWCFLIAFNTYGLTLWRAPTKITDTNGDHPVHYVAATGNTNDTQARRDIISVAERDSRFKGSVSDLWSDLNWSPPWELRRMAFEFAGQPLGTGIYVYQATYSGLDLRYTQYYDPATQAWTPWHQETGTN